MPFSNFTLVQLDHLGPEHMFFDFQKIISIIKQRLTWGKRTINNEIRRENLKKGLKNLKDDDLVVISDLDEIPNFDNLDFNKINNNIMMKYSNSFLEIHINHFLLGIPLFFVFFC